MKRTEKFEQLPEGNWSEFNKIDQKRKRIWSKFVSGERICHGSYLWNYQKNPKGVNLMELTNLKWKNNELVSFKGNLMEKSCFDKKLYSFKFFLWRHIFYVSANVSKNWKKAYVNFWFSERQYNGACLWKIWGLQHVPIRFYKGGRIHSPALQSPKKPNRTRVNMISRKIKMSCSKKPGNITM